MSSSSMDRGRAPWRPRRFGLAVLWMVPGVAAMAAAEEEVLEDPPATPGSVEEEPSSGWELGYEDCLFLCSPDHRNQIEIEGLLQVNGRLNDRGRSPRSDTELRRMRLEVAGRFDEAWRFRMEPNFNDHGVELEEAWFGAEVFSGDALLRIGRMKAPFGLEEVRSRRHIDFGRFSILNQFSPAEDHGLFLYGETPSGRWEWNLAAYNGTGSSDTNSSKDVAGRLMVHPFSGQEDSALESLQLGAAVTFGSQAEDVGGSHVENAAGLPIMEFAPGARLDGDRLRTGLEAAWYHGPWMAQAEWMRMSQDMSLDGPDAGSAREVDFQGAYLNLSYVLTGESKSFGGVHPESSFDPRGGGGSGAWVLALRLSQLESDGELASSASGLMLADAFTDRVQSVSVGLNWIPNPHAIVRTGFVHSEYSDEVAIGGSLRDREDALLIELQLHF